MNAHFSFPPRSQRCAKKGELLADFDHIFSTLIEEKGNLERRDFCPACFESLDFSCVMVWRVKPKKKQKRDWQSLFSHLQDLLQENKEEFKPFVYGLALFLERAKILSRKGSLDKYILFSHTKSDARFQIEVVERLSPDVLQALGELLK